MSDEPRPKPPVRPAAHNSPSDGEWSPINDVIGNIVIALCVVGAVIILVLAVVGAFGG